MFQNKFTQKIYGTNSRKNTGCCYIENYRVAVLLWIFTNTCVLELYIGVLYICMYMQMFGLCIGLLQKNALSLKITSRAQYHYFKINFKKGR